MKNKIKDFCSKHEDELVRLGYYTAGCVTTCLAFTLMVKGYDRAQPKSTMPITNANGREGVLVQLADGTVKAFWKPKNQ